MTQRCFLFLQGPPSHFAVELGDALKQAGHRVERVNLCTGDRLFWRRKGAVNYRGRLADWEEWLTDFVRRTGVTDILYYADRLPYHVIASRVADRLGVNAVAYEFGYLRPDWITLERRGMSAFSHFPDDPDHIREAARDLAEPDLTVHYPYAHLIEALNEVTYNLSTYFFRPLYPFYEPDRIYDVLYEYVTHVPRILSSRRETRRSAVIVDRICEEGAPFFLLPLQIQADYQLRDNAPYKHQNEMIEQVLRSFARHAAPETRLVVKQHPLDSGIEGWEACVNRVAEACGLQGRVDFIKAGDLGKLLRHARGTVLINSTVGVHAIRHGGAVKVLGIATYDIPGLTHQGSLESFWSRPQVPDEELCAAFIRLMAHAIQVKGNFYTRAGRKAGVANIARRLSEGTVNQPGAFVAEPPRYARARAMGLPVPSGSPAKGVRKPFPAPDYGRPAATQNPAE